MSLLPQTPESLRLEGCATVPTKPFTFNNPQHTLNQWSQKVEGLGLQPTACLKSWVQYPAQKTKKCRQRQTCVLESFQGFSNNARSNSETLHYIFNTNTFKYTYKFSLHNYMSILVQNSKLLLIFISSSSKGDTI